VKDERVYLLHAIEAINAILSYTVDGREAFLGDGKTQDAVVRNIEIIGEAAKRITEPTRALDTSIPWRKIAGMRDKLIHELERTSRRPFASCAGAQSSSRKRSARAAWNR